MTHMAACPWQKKPQLRCRQQIRHLVILGKFKHALSYSTAKNNHPSLFISWHLLGNYITIAFKGLNVIKLHVIGFLQLNPSDIMRS